MNNSDVQALLRGASLRVTGPRVAVLSVIHRHPHLDVGAIVEQVRERIGAVSTQAVYGVLNTLVDSGLARRIDLPNSPARYEGQAGDDHQHLVCRDCGRIADVERLHSPVPLSPADDQGFSVESVEVTYWGSCPDCRAAHSAEPTASDRAH